MGRPTVTVALPPSHYAAVLDPTTMPTLEVLEQVERVVADQVRSELWAKTYRLVHFQPH